YGWAYAPWGPGVAFAWGWGADPWFGYYGYYFAPYPVYTDASLWLTDYILAENLQAAYQAQVDGNGGAATAAASDDGGANGGGNVALSPEVKKAIDEEVKAQLAAQQAAAAPAASGPATATNNTEQVPAALDPRFTTFIVSTPLQEQLEAGATCSLSTG